jgi:hypothetical protein
MRLYEPLKREHALAFGRVIGAWAYLESVLDEGVEALFPELPMDWIGYLAAQFDYPRKREVIRNLLPIHVPDKSVVDEHLREIERLNKIRVLVAHSIWVEGKAAGAIKPAGVKGRKLEFRGYEDNEKEYTAKELTEEAQKMMNAADALANLMRDSGLDVGW